ncbi:MAG: hypothetical protein ACLUIQ_12105 [Dialister invisus]
MERRKSGEVLSLTGSAAGMSRRNAGKRFSICGKRNAHRPDDKSAFGSVEEEYSYEGSALSMKDSGIILGAACLRGKQDYFWHWQWENKKYRRNQKLLFGDQGRIENHCGTRNPFSKQS